MIELLFYLNFNKTVKRVYNNLMYFLNLILMPESVPPHSRTTREDS